MKKYKLNISREEYGWVEVEAESEEEAREEFLEGDLVDNVIWVNESIEIQSIEEQDIEEERFCVKCGKCSDLIEEENLCYSCANERGRV